jgi:uncharacterized hydrophobic protein (TIGR00341 family)
MIEVFAPTEYADAINGFLKEHRHHGLWTDRLSEDRCLVRALVPTEGTEAVIDVMEKRFSNVEGFRLMLFSVEATVPRPPEAPPAQEAKGEEVAPPKPAMRISREELYEDLHKGAYLSKHYLAMLDLASVVAAIGLLRDNPAVTIGAMVIAPLLGPNVALALATTLGDGALARRAVAATGVGILLVLLLAAVMGTLCRVEPHLCLVDASTGDFVSAEIRSRTEVWWGDIALALAAGGAGALAFTAGFATTLVGVMVAVALLPPLVTAGLLFGGGFFRESLGAFHLFLINLICVNLAGVTAFWLEGIRPKRWWEAQKAGQATRRAITIWVLLLILAALLFLLGCSAPARTDAEKAKRIEALYEDYRVEFAGTPEVTVGELREKLSQGEVVVVDVRPESERRVSALPSAVGKEAYLTDPEAYEGKEAVCYCTIGYRSGFFVKKLHEKGAKAFNLRGGILAWLHAGEKVFAGGKETTRVHVYGPKWDLAPWRCASTY